MTQDYAATTGGVLVTVQPLFLEDQSEPDEGRYVWAYRVRIVNQGVKAVQLMHRSWEITDGRGHTVKVSGPGVIGEQPVIQAGESYEYMSGAPLGTPSGFMVGKYHMVFPASGEPFDVAIPAFSLDSPHDTGLVH